MDDPRVLSQLNTLKRQYFQLVEPLHLRWPNDTALKAPEVQSWMFQNLFDTSRVISPPLERYQLRVLKQLISKLEKLIDNPEEDEISDDLMSALSSLLTFSVSSEAEAAQQKAFVTYSYPQTSTSSNSMEEWAVTLFEARPIISSSGTTGLRTWEAALILGSYFVSDIGQKQVHGKRMFELGAGTGMLSILCAKYLGVAGVVATDGDEAVVDAIKSNLFLNRLDNSDRVWTAALKWGGLIDPKAFTEDYGMEAPDILFGADVTYDTSVNPRLVSTLWEFFELNPELEVFISATIRNEETFETFLNACKRNHFKLAQLDFPPVPEDLQNGPFYPTSPSIQIWHIGKK